MIRRPATSAAALVAMLLASAPSGALARIGEVGAANPTIEGTPPDGSGRVLRIGAEVVQDERIETSASGTGQILFLDQTTLTVAPDSDIVLDRYVFDPDRSTGEIGLSLSRGALRFIGGRVTKGSEGRIETPAATIGIRGGALLVEVDEERTTTVVFLAGERAVVEANGRRITLSRTGGTVVVPFQQLPEWRGIAEVGEIDRLYRLFEREGGGGRTKPLPREAVGPGLERGVAGAAAGERGGPFRTVVSTSGAQRIDDLPLLDERGNPQGSFLSPLFDDPDIDDGEVEPDPDPDPDPEIVFEQTATPTGLVGVALVAGDGAVLTAAPPPGGGATLLGAPPPGDISDPAAQNQLLRQSTVDPLPSVDETEATVTEDGDLVFRSVSLDGINRDGETYVVPVEEGGGTLSYDDGASPLVPREEDEAALAFTGLSGISDYEPDEMFASAYYDEGARTQVFFGEPTPGQGRFAGMYGPAVRTYRLREDPFLNEDSSIAEGRRILGPQVTGAFSGGAEGFDPRLRLLESDDGLFALEDGEADGKAALGLLTVEGEGTEQRSVMLVGSGAVRATADGAPSPDLDMYGSLAEGAGGAPVALEAGGTFVAFGDGSTLVGDRGRNAVFASGTRFLVDDDEAYEQTPVTTGAFDGEGAEARGFAHVAELTEVRDQNSGVSLADTYDDAASSGFRFQTGSDYDNAFNGGYAAGLGRTDIAGETSAPYVLKSDGEGVLMTFDADSNDVLAVLNMQVGPLELFSDEDYGFSTARPPANAVSSAGGTEPPFPGTSVVLGFGGRGEASALVESTDFVAVEARDADLSPTFFTTGIGGDQPATDPDTGEQTGFEGAIATDAALDGARDGLFPEGVDTTPTYLRWGYWAGTFERMPDMSDPPGTPSTRDRFHAGTWVAGNRLDEEILPFSGSATFEGHAVVSVSEGGSDYLDGGGFSLAYDYGERAGTAAFTDLAGYDFSVAVDDRGTVGPDFESEGRDAYAGDFFASGSTASTDPLAERPDITGRMSGSFFGDSNPFSLPQGPDGDINPLEVRATAGHIEFEATDGSLTASGVFGGDRE